MTTDPTTVPLVPTDSERATDAAHAARDRRWSHDTETAAFHASRVRRFLFAGDVVGALTAVNAWEGAHRRLEGGRL